MDLLDHVSITVGQLERALPFYEAIMGALGAAQAYRLEDAVGYGERNSDADDSHSYLSIFASSAAMADPRRHVCLRAASREQVHAFYVAGLAAGGRCAGAPGLRPYHINYYAAFLLDPDGNKIEAVCHRGAPDVN